ncbi:MAG: hydrogenase [Fibrobacter sp.]|nr:hydrogenase [Fibrobacter sp.]
MTNLLNAILVIILMLNLFTLGTTRIQSIIRIVAFQGILLGILPLITHDGLSLMAVAASIIAIVLKGFAIPVMMSHALRDVQIKREVEPLIGILPSIILGALATVFALLFASQMPLANENLSKLIVPSAIATILVGFILLTTRFKALTQVIGYLILENGIFIFGVLLMEAMPMVIEMGVLLDLFVGIFVSCIIISKINQSFSSMDTRILSSLKE